jgi:hypothetical protein
MLSYINAYFVLLVADSLRLRLGNGRLRGLYKICFLSLWCGVQLLGIYVESFCWNAGFCRRESQR